METAKEATLTMGIGGSPWGEAHRRERARQEPIAHWFRHTGVAARCWHGRDEPSNSGPILSPPLRLAIRSSTCYALPPMDPFDLVAIGGRPAGSRAALIAAAYGRRGP